jgi:precorrin-6A/cobalt-precorrin-6A reductase
MPTSASHGRALAGGALDRADALSDNRSMHILILGGTTEASALAALLAPREDLVATLSLAGRTTAPKALPIRTRIGGFGGPAGLAEWIEAENVAAVVDATHPFAAQISHNAAEACAETGTPLLGVRRPQWLPVEGDRWIEVDSMSEAVQALGPAPRRVFLTVGRLELDHFVAAPQHHYVVRTIEPIPKSFPLPELTAIRDRGPFQEEAEAALMRRHRIEVVVTKNSGGAATYGKIAAARTLRLPVVLVRQPQKPDVASVEQPAQALDWILRHARAP